MTKNFEKKKYIILKLFELPDLFMLDNFFSKYIISIKLDQVTCFIPQKDSEKLGLILT